MVRIELFNGGSGSSGNGSPPPVSPSSCSSWPPPLPNTFPYPPQEASFGYPVSCPVSYYTTDPYPYGYGYGYGYGYAPYVEYVSYNVDYQPQTWFQPPVQTGSGQAENPVRSSGFGRGEDVLQKGTTTLMIRNIPTRLRRDELINLLDEHCKEQNKGAQRLSPNHKAAYDFIYLPFDFIKRGNLGYAFVNFTTARAAYKFFNCWSGRGWMDFYQCPKICAITRADIQGKEPSKRHLERCTFFCDTEEYLPMESSPPRDGYNAAVVRMTTFGNRVRRSEKMAWVWRKKKV